MAATTTTDWATYYRDRCQDKGTIEALYSMNDDEFADISKSHNNDAASLRSTISNSGGGNFLLVPGAKGTVKFLHQGFATTTHLGGETILGFIQGNFSSSPFKVLETPSQATLPIDLGRSTTRNNGDPIACPTLGAFFGATSPDTFANLPDEAEGTLNERPNHLFIHPTVGYSRGRRAPSQLKPRIWPMP